MCLARSHCPVLFTVLLLAAAPVGGAVHARKPQVAAARSTDSPEMTAMFDADQSARQEMTKIDWAVLGPQDEKRRLRTKALLDSGMLKTASDFYHAALVFQHGRKPDDYLLAHTLAVVAVAQGRADATWIASATLDRYLINIGQKQIYGTQYRTVEGGATSQDPFDRSLVSDVLRAALHVPPLAEQEKQRKAFEDSLRGWRRH
jgi:hypothetical protein